METALQLALIAIWGTLGTIHTRRLFRLAMVPARTGRKEYLRVKAQRIRWLLERDEFLSVLQRDMLRCVMLSLMVLVFALG
jgi:hypothetical protein